MTSPKIIREEPTPAMIEAAYTELMGRDLSTPSRARRAARDVWLSMWAMSPPPEDTMGLTRHQQSVHRVIAEYQAEHGISPTITEIHELSTVPSHNHTRTVINALERCGVLKRPRKFKPRNIVLCIQPGEPLPMPRYRRKAKTK